MIDTKSVLKIDQKSFEKATSQGVALVDFWAEWCMPCRMQGPILDSLAKNIGDKAVIAKLNVDESPEISEKFGIVSIPTLIILKNGEPVKKFVGVQNEAALTKAINEII